MRYMPSPHIRCHEHESAPARSCARRRAVAQHLPTRRWEPGWGIVYLLYGRKEGEGADRLLYVGQSTNGTRRIAVHETKLARKGYHLAHGDYMEMPGGDLDRVEAALIRLFQPPMNKKERARPTEEDMETVRGLCLDLPDGLWRDAVEEVRRDPTLASPEVHERTRQRRARYNPPVEETISADEVRKIRLALRMSQAQFADMCGVSQPFVFYLEHGKRTALPETAERIRNAAPCGFKYAPE